MFYLFPYNYGLLGLLLDCMLSNFKIGCNFNKENKTFILYESIIPSNNYIVFPLLVLAVKLVTTHYQSSESISSE